jgi:hypothetical protein
MFTGIAQPPWEDFETIRPRPTGSEDPADAAAEADVAVTGNMLEPIIADGPGAGWARRNGPRSLRGRPGDVAAVRPAA